MQPMASVEQPVFTRAAAIARGPLVCGVKVLSALEMAAPLFSRSEANIARTWRALLGDLSPLSPELEGLSPHQVGTGLFNGDKGLAQFFNLSPLSPLKNARARGHVSAAHAPVAAGPYWK